MKAQHTLDKHWLAGLLVNAALQKVDMTDFLQQAAQTLPAPYQALLQRLQNNWAAQQSLTAMLAEFSDKEIDQLAHMLARAPDEETAILQRWNESRQRLSRTQILLQQTMLIRLSYLSLLMGVSWLVCCLFLTYIAPSYADWFIPMADTVEAAEAYMPSVTRFWYRVANGNGWYAIVQILLYWSGPLVLTYFAYCFVMINKLRQRQAISTRWVPWLKPLQSLRHLYEMSFGAEPALEEVQKLVSATEYAELVLAKQFGYLPQQAAQLFMLPESYWAELTARPFNRMANKMTALLWLGVAVFLISMYQPIFSLGTST